MTSPSGVQWEVFRSGPYDTIVIRFSIGHGGGKSTIARGYCPRMLRSLLGSIEPDLVECVQSLIGSRPAENDDLIVQAAQALKVEAMLMPAKGRSMSHPPLRRSS